MNQPMPYADILIGEMNNVIKRLENEVSDLDLQRKEKKAALSRYRKQLRDLTGERPTRNGPVGRRNDSDGRGGGNHAAK